MRLPNEGRLYSTKRFKGTDEEVNEQWLLFRKEGIGGSEVAGIMGISKWQTPISIWLEKTNRAEPSDISSSPYVDWGNRLEQPIREKFRDEHPGWKVIAPNVTLVSKDRPWAHASLDGLVRDPDRGWGILEIKTARSRDGWWDGEEESVPTYYLTQAVHYMSVTGLRYARFAVLIAGSEYIERLVEWDDEDVALVVEAVDSFWNDNVVCDVMPDIVTSSPSDSKAMHRMYVHSDEDMDIEHEEEAERLMAEFMEAAEQEKAAKERKAIASTSLKRLIGGHKGIVGSEHVATWPRSEKRDSGIRVKRKVA